MVFAPLSKHAYATLADAAAEAVQQIYESGLSFRGGVLSPGHNNVRADQAAMAFNADDLDRLSRDDSAEVRLYADMIRLRQDFAALTGVDNPREAALLQGMFDRAETLKTLGWEPRSPLVRLVTTGFSAAASGDFAAGSSQWTRLGNDWNALPDAAKRLLPDRKP